MDWTHVTVLILAIFSKGRRRRKVKRRGQQQGAIRLIHEFAITGLITRQLLLMADRTCHCFFFISNKFNGLIFNMEYSIT